ncbi:MAG TPA: type I-E CRISPR-associated protein Cse1/CasA [Thermomicrobiales bacterium]|jgi:CRISPR system Cascade subunit CasA
MTASYNLIEEGWIPCLWEDGRPEEVGLREALGEAQRIREVSDPSPLIAVALHRLLLAILHRTFGPANEQEWAALWRAGRFDGRALDAYFDRWRSRFDLFDERFPFYQTRSLDPAYGGPVSKMPLSAGKNSPLFDHGTDDDRGVLPAAEAARELVALQSFAIGGFVAYERELDPKLYKSADGAPLAKGAVCLVAGPDLFRTLMLNLHRYSPRDHEPFRFHGDDRPAWERDEETRAEDRQPAGYLDYLTWQSRRARLLPGDDGGAAPVVARAVIMKGNQFPESWTVHDGETMIAFAKNKKPAKGQQPWSPVGFREERAVWRDSLALMQSIDDDSDRPRIAAWLGDLVASGVLDRSQAIPIDLMGLCSDQAKVLFWRQERLPLPLAYLADRTLVLDGLRPALRVGEEVVERVLDPVGRSLVKLLLAPMSDQPQGRQPEIGGLTASLGLRRRYWSRLDVAFQRLLVDLPGDKERSFAADPDRWPEGGEAYQAWLHDVEQAARRAFDETAHGVGTSPRALKAVARAEREFGARLRALLKEKGMSKEERSG